MASKVIRYRYAVLLLWVAMALVTNPVWHGVGHEHVDHHGDQTETTDEAKWASQDVCPYCDAVSLFSQSPSTEAQKRPMALLWRIEPSKLHFAKQHFLHATPLRAPPFLA